MPALAGRAWGDVGGWYAGEIVLRLEDERVVREGIAQDVGVDGPEEAGTVGARGLEELAHAAVLQKPAGGDEGLEAGVVAGLFAVAFGKLAQGGAVAAHASALEEVQERGDGGFFPGDGAEAVEVRVHGGKLCR